MDHWIAGFQGLGLALACGALLGGIGLRGVAAWMFGAVAAVGGAYLFGLSLTSDFGVAQIADSGHPTWPGWLAGAVFASISYFVWRGVAARASARGGQTAFGIPVLIGISTLAIAGLCLVVPFIGALPLIFTVWVWIGRRRREGRKHEGLRVLK